MVGNAALSDALFTLAETHPPGEERLALLRAAYAVFDHPRELAELRRIPETVSLEALPTVALLRGVRSDEALPALVERLAGPHPVRRGGSRQGFLSNAEVQRTLATAGTLNPAHLRGAAHWHTQASDGAASLERMASACQRRGYSWAVVADHTRGLACVNGLDGDGIRLQRARVEAWNRSRGEDMTLFHGLEVEILGDGRLDLPREARQGVLVLAAVHTGLHERKDQTSRLLRALDEPGVWALAHPRGRMFARRGGVRATWESVLQAAADREVLVEVNGFPRRQDLDVPLLQIARECGCRFLLASDAHHPRHLAFDGTALALASAAGIPADRIVNFSAADRVESMLE